MSIQEEVGMEIRRQQYLKSQGRFGYTCSDDVSNLFRLAILSEEIGEIAREVLAYTGEVQEAPNRHKLKTEIVQAIAVLCSWLIGIENYPGMDGTP